MEKYYFSGPTIKYYFEFFLIGYFIKKYKFLFDVITCNEISEPPNRRFKFSRLPIISSFINLIFKFIVGFIKPTYRFNGRFEKNILDEDIQEKEIAFLQVFIIYNWKNIKIVSL